MKLLEEKVAIVTGGGRGLGKEYALAFAKEGAKVVVNDIGCGIDGEGRDYSIAEKVVREIKDAGGEALASTESVAVKEEVEVMVEKTLDAFGRIDILVNNAGIIRDRTVLKMSEGDWEEVLNVNLKGMFLCTQAVAKVMKEQGEGGRIINTTALSAFTGNYGQANYVASAAGIVGLTKVSAIEFAKYRINVNCIAPVAITRMTESHPVFKGVNKEELHPQLVVPLVIYLASELSESFSGYTIGIMGNRIFSYQVHLTEGIDKGRVWRPLEIHECFKKIVGEE